MNITEPNLAQPAIRQKTFLNENEIETGIYEKCHFLDCRFSNLYLADISFNECMFYNCNLSFVNVKRTTFSSVYFTKCKLLGINFSRCNKNISTLAFEDCILDISSFQNLVLPSTYFKNCSLEEVNFSQADLSGAVFDNCNLKNAIFWGTKMENANFLTAKNFLIDPEQNNLYKAKFSVNGAMDLLNHFGIDIIK